MKTRSLGKFFGVELKIHGTFLLLLAFVAISGALRGGVLDALLSVLLSLTVFSVVVLHEFGHVFAARRYGIKTKDVILSPLGGVARLKGSLREPKQEAFVAAAGPLVNLVLAAVGFLVLPLIGETSTTLVVLKALGDWFIKINLVLLGFNLIPALPMDGGRILRALLTKKWGHVKATEKAAKVARWSSLLMALYGIYAGHFTLVFIAAFVFVMSWVELFQARLRGGQNSPVLQIFQQFRNQGRRPQQSTSNAKGVVVDQDGNPVQSSGGTGSWSVSGAKWVDPK